MITSNSNAGASWGGPITITDAYGNQVNGFAAGDLVPAVQRGSVDFDAIAFGFQPTGIMTGGFGMGYMELNFAGDIGDPFLGSLQLASPR
jgi:hypothetical protein